MNRPTGDEFFDSQRAYEDAHRQGGHKGYPGGSRFQQAPIDPLSELDTPITFHDRENLVVAQIGGDVYLTKDVEFLSHEDGKVVPRSVTNINPRLELSGEIIPPIVIAGKRHRWSSGCYQYHVIPSYYDESDGRQHPLSVYVHLVPEGMSRRCSYCHKTVCLAHAYRFQGKYAPTVCPHCLGQGVAELERRESYRARKSLTQAFFQLLGFGKDTGSPGAQERASQQYPSPSQGAGVPQSYPSTQRRYPSQRRYSDRRSFPSQPNHRYRQTRGSSRDERF